MSDRFELILARALCSEDPVRALARAAQDPGIDDDVRAMMRNADPAGVRMSALLIARLRFERLLRGSPEAEAWFDSEPERFSAAFRAYHLAVPPSAFFPRDERELFLTWCDRTGESPAAMSEPKSTNIKWHEGDLTRDERWKLLGCKGATMWFTGLSGSGKSTIASALEQVLVERKITAYRLDGDNIRYGLNANLAFSAEDRTENIRRIGEVAKLFADAGVIALTSFISPYRVDRERVRKLHEAAGLAFIEVFVDTPIEVCEQRDPKGLYRKARKGELKNFTGIDDPYEAPTQPELTLKTAETPIDRAVEMCLEFLKNHGIA